MPNTGTVEQRIVEMQIDHEKFESGAKRTISILEKLDEGLKSLGKNNADGFDSVAKSLDKVTDRFSAMGIVGDQVIRTITNRAIGLIDQMGKLAKSMSIDQITAGWSKYGEKTQGVQTIMAATAKDWKDQGAQIEWVNSQLERLNLFTDETSYNFLDMVNNIGKFTSNGVKLETAVTAMEGISNWAAISGGNVNEASRAMYNLSQALATGSVKLIDWKSIENANMATREFKETALETAVALGTLTKSGSKFITKTGKEFTTEQFNTQLSEGWFSSEVLLETLNLYGAFTDVLLETSEETGVTVTELLQMVDTYKETGKASADLMPYIKELAKDEYDLGRRAFKAAQEAKTFEEAIAATKDAVSTGWMNLFETMFGNYLTAKEFWTDVANSLYNIFAEPVNRLNEIFGLAFGENNPLKDYLSEAGLSMNDLETAAAKFANDSYIAFGGAILPSGIKALVDQYGSLEKAIKAGAVSAEQLQHILKQVSADKVSDLVFGKNDNFNSELEKYQAYAKDLLSGKIKEETILKNGLNLEMVKWWANYYRQTAKAITATGGPSSSSKDNVIELQKVLKTVDQLTDEEVAKLVEKFGSVEEAIKRGIVAPDSRTSYRELLRKFADEFGDEAMLKLAGYTEDEIEKMKELGITAEDVLAAMRDPKVLRAEGFKLFTESIVNLLTVFEKLGDAATNALSILFGGSDDKEGYALANETMAEGIYGLIERFNKFTQSIQITDEKMEELENKFLNFFSTFGSIKSIGESVKSILSGIVNIVARIFSFVWNSGILQSVGLSFLLVLQALLIPIQLIVTGLTTLFNKGKELGKQVWAKTLSSWLSTIATRITTAATAFKDFMASSKVSEWFANTLQRIANYAGKIGDWFNKLYKRVRAFGKILKDEFNANGIIGVIDLIKEKVVEKFTKFFDDVKKVYNAEGLKGLLKGFIERIVSFFSSGKSIDDITKAIGAFFDNVFEKVGTFIFGKVNSEKITNFIESIKSFFAGIFSGVGKFLSKNINLTKLGEFFSGLGEAFSEGFSNVGKFISDHFSLEKIGEFLGEFLQLIGELAKNAESVVRYGALIVIFINIAKWSWVLSDAVWSISDFAEGVSHIGWAGVIGALAGLVLAIAAAIAVFALIPKDKFLPALGMLAATMIFIGGVLFGVVKLIGLLDKLVPSTKLAVAKMALLTPIMISIGLSILMIVGALAILANMDTRKLIKGFIALSALLFELMAFMFSIGVSARIAGNGSLKDILYVAASIWLIGKTLQNLANLSIGQMLKGWLGLKLIVGQIIRFTLKRGYMPKESGLKDLLSIAVGIWLIGKTLKNLGELSVGQILKGWLGLKLIIGQIIRFTKKSIAINGKQLWGLIGLAASVALIARSFKKLSDMSIADIVKAWIATFALIGQLTRVMRASITKRGGSINGKSFWGLIAVALAVATLAEVMVRLGRVPAKQLAKGGLAISALMFALGRMMKSAAPLLNGHVKGQGLKNVLTCLGMVGVIAASAYALKKLSDIPANKLLPAAGALSAVLIAIAGSMTILNAFSGGFKWGTIGLLAAGIGGLWLVAEILTPLGESNLDWEKIGKVALVLIGTLVGVAAAAYLIGKIPTGAALKGVGAVGLIIGAIELVVLALMEIGLALIATATTMATKLSDFTAALQPFLDSIKSYDESTVEDLERFSRMMELLSLSQLFTAVASALALVPSDALFDDLTKLGWKVKMFAISISTLTEADVERIRTFGGVMSAIAEITAWEALASIFTWISSWFDTTDKFVDSAGEHEVTTTSAEKVFSNLSALAIGVSSMLGELKDVSFDDEAVSKVQGLASVMEALTEVTAWNVLATMMNALGNGLDRIADKFGPNLRVNLMLLVGSIKNLVEGISGEEFNVDDKTKNKITNFVDIMQLLTQITKWDTVAKMFNAIGNKFGTDYSDSVANLPNTVRALVNAIVGTEEDDKNGWGSLGDKALDKVKTFADVMQILSNITKWHNIGKLFTTVGELFGIDYSEKLNALPGTVRDFVDEIVQQNFPSDYPKKIEEFSNVMGELVQIVGLETVADIIGKLGNDAPNSMQRLREFTNHLSAFLKNISVLDGTSIPKLQLLNNFMKEFAATNFTASWNEFVSAATETLGAGFFHYIDEYGNDVSKFTVLAQQLEEFGTAIGPFLDVMAEIDISNIEKARELFSALNFVGSNNVFTNFGEDIQNILSLNVFKLSEEELEKRLGRVETMTEFLNAILGFSDTLHKSLSGQQGMMTAAVSNTIDNALSESDAANAKTAFFNGFHIATGVAQGIYAGAPTVQKAASALGVIANNAFAATEEIASPSRAFARLGAFLPAGLAKGIEEGSPAAEESITIMGSAILAAMQEAMMSIATVADESFEYNPMITPVVDLDNVTTAAGSARGMFGGIGTTMRSSMRVSMDSAQNAAAAVSYGNGSDSIVSEIQHLGARFDNLAEAVSNMKIVLDSGQLVGATSGQMDAALGVRQIRKGRGN